MVRPTVLIRVMRVRLLLPPPDMARAPGLGLLNRSLKRWVEGIRFDSFTGFQKNPHMLTRMRVSLFISIGMIVWYWCITQNREEYNEHHRKDR